jgi:hypothetical protein
MNRTFAVLFACAWGVAFSAPVVFPGTSAVARSPVGGSSLFWVEAHDEIPHSLQLRMANGDVRPIMNIERWAAVQWSPSGKQFAITDAFASDQSRVIAFTVSAEGPTSLEIKLPSQLQRTLSANHHSYVQVEGWSQHGLQLVAWGYGAPSRESFRNRVLCVAAQTTMNCRVTNDR